MAGWYDLKTAKDGQTYFVLKAGNNETILKSEMYKAKASAENGIASVQKNSPQDGRYDRKVATNGQFHFNLKAGNHEIIGQSELYTTESARDNGIASVKTNGPTTTIKDNTAG